MDKYAFRKPDGKSVFFQKDKAGKTYAPFNLDIKNTRATWMSSLPHSWTNQQNALNKGKYDQWLLAKDPG
jgi:phospholipase C